MVKVIGIDELGRTNLSRRAVFEKLSQMPRAGVKDTLATNHPSEKRREVHYNRGRSFPKHPSGKRD
jgi:hypothetical protein